MQQMLRSLLEHLDFRPFAGQSSQSDWPLTARQMANLKETLMSIDEVPKDSKLYFWDGQLWLRWEDDNELPGSERDPLRIKVVCFHHAGELVFSKKSGHVAQALMMVPCKVQGLHMPLVSQYNPYSMQPLSIACRLRVCCCSHSASNKVCHVLVECLSASLCSF